MCGKKATGINKTRQHTVVIHVRRCGIAIKYNEKKIIK